MDSLQNYIEEELQTPLGGDLDASRAAEAASLAQSLARAAYVDLDESSRGLVERMLYQMHTAHGFSNPVQAGVGQVWSILMTTKLRSSLTNRAQASELSADEMVDRLTTAVRDAEARDHTLLDEITAADDPQGLVIYTKNWFSSTHGFTSQLLAMCQRCNSVPAMQAVLEAALENIEEEFNPSEPHQKLRRRWPEAIGVNYEVAEAIVDADQTTEAFSLQNLRTGLALLSHPTFSLGSFFTVEANFPSVCTRMYEGLKGKYSDEALAIFKSHAGADIEHSNEWLDALTRCDLTPAQRVEVVNGGLAQIAVRSAMFDAMRKLVATRSGAAGA